MQRWGEILGRRAGVVLALGLAIVAAAAIFGLGAFGSLQNGGFDDPGSQSYKAAQVVNDKFPTAREDAVVVYRSADKVVSDPAFGAQVQRTISNLDRADVIGVTAWYNSRAPGLISADQHSVRVVLHLAGDDDNTRIESFDAIKDSLQVPGLTVNIGGQYAVFADINEQVGKDIARAEMISMPIVFLLSLLIFGSVAAALMPTMVGGVAVLGAFAVVRLITGVADVSVFAINVITLLGMGLAIDYALFIVTRFRDELALRPTTDRADVGIAMGRTMATAGRTVFFSGTIVAASLLSLLTFPQMFLRSMAYGGTAAVLVAMVTSLTLLPAVLVLLGRRISWGTLPHRKSATERASRWAQIAAAVMRRPVLVLVATTAALLLLAAPFLGVKWGSTDERMLPASASSRVTTSVITENFGERGPIATAVLRGATPADAAAYADRAKSISGVQSAAVAGSSGSDQLVVVRWNGAAQTTASQDIVHELRGMGPGGADQLLVGGQTAQTIDLVDSVGQRLPWMAVIVAVVMFLLLFLAFGSILLPLKAIVMSAISLGASFGIVTWIFQDGNLSGLLGFTATGYLDVTQPILMLAILFGLSMDYEVFLLSRVREEWDRGHDNTSAVVAGVRSTGKIITSAALLLAVVIGGFATSGIVFLKMIGVGMLVAVLLDATVVRALLVPATMRLIGPYNWWAPPPMRRWWERHGHREHVADDAEATGRPQLEPVQ